MERIKLKTETAERLAEIYAEEAIKRAEAKRIGVANRHATRIFAIGSELRRRGPEAQAKLLPLLSHPSPEVRCWVATHALEFAPEQAKPVLEALLQEPPGAIPASAGMALDLWEKGELELP